MPEIMEQQVVPPLKSRSGKRKAGSRNGSWKATVDKLLAESAAEQARLQGRVRELEDSLRQLQGELGWERRWRLHWEGVARANHNPDCQCLQLQGR